MSKHNTHRAAGRALTPVSGVAGTAAKGFGGAAVLGGLIAAGSGVAAQAQTTSVPAAPQVNVAASAPVAAAAPAYANAKPLVAPAGPRMLWGSRGDSVRDLQKALNDNDANLAEDGIFGPRTHRAVINYQSENGLRVDGIVGPQTRASLAGNGGDTVEASYSAPQRSTSSNTIVRAARSQIGTTYRYGGNTPNGFDCSGLVRFAYAQAGIDVPRTSYQQRATGTRISQSEARPGDLVAYPGHVGIYLGNGKVIDASLSQGRVVERHIWGNPTFLTFR
ncbi:C40 family peptidase [Devriesea agamarum]|uniref:C40 family peptidase n=1 Tax=Devriesea agamarum TaxID=472569 RepID=UPI00071C8883|nr:NlpC/P60 family protein [Devriesea agamarum]